MYQFSTNGQERQKNKYNELNFPDSPRDFVGDLHMEFELLIYCYFVAKRGESYKNEVPHYISKIKTLIIS